MHSMPTCTVANVQSTTHSHKQQLRQWCLSQEVMNGGYTSVMFSVSNTSHPYEKTVAKPFFNTQHNTTELSGWSILDRTDSSFETGGCLYCMSKWVAETLCTLYITDHCFEAGSSILWESEWAVKAQCFMEGRPVGAAYCLWVSERLKRFLLCA